MALPIFPGRHQPSIVGANELNFCVRDGNRWTLIAINTNYLFRRGFVPLDSVIVSQTKRFVNNFFSKSILFSKINKKAARFHKWLGAPCWTCFSAKKPRQLQQSTGLLPGAAFQLQQPTDQQTDTRPAGRRRIAALELPVFPGRPSIVAAVASVRWTLAGRKT